MSLGMLVSWNIPGSTTTIAVENLVKKGVHVVVAAGNDGFKGGE